MDLAEFLTRDSDGFVHLAGQRIGLHHIVHLYNEGYSAEALLDEFPTLSLALIHKTLAFYLENRSEVDAYAGACRVEFEAQVAAARLGPDMAELRRRFDAMRPAKAS